MHSAAIAKIATALRKGEPPQAQPWDIGAAVDLLAGELRSAGITVSAGEVRAATGMLNKRLHFEHTVQLAQCWEASRGFDPTIAKHHAQALIDLGALEAAETVLREAAALGAQPGAGAQAAAEMAEYAGLLARIDKQRFVASGDLDALMRATKRYSAQYEANPLKPYWHGINVVALLARSEREAVQVTGSASAVALAGAIYQQVVARYQRNAGDPWLAATASEASMALDECDQAELWLYRFLHHPKTQPFDVESYHRQLREIWQGNHCAGSVTCADRLATIMSRHIARTQSRWSVQTSAIQSMAREIDRDAGGFEKNFLGEASFGVDMVRRMLNACASIGCVTNRSGERLGTGFLIAGDRLRESFGSEPVFVTNAHVVSDAAPNAIPVADARVTFEVASAAAAQPIYYRIGEVLFTSPPGDLGVLSPSIDHLDVTVARLETSCTGFSALSMATALPLIDAKAKAYVVGHPRGSGLQISLHDSLLLDIDDDERLIHYRTPTDPGNSGSPVFNAQWEVIGVHHGGSSKTPRLRGLGTYEANEAIALGAIRRKLN